MELSTYPVPELLLKWQREELTPEQMIGHLLQHLLTLLQRLAELATQLRQLEQRLRQLEQPAPAARKPK